MTFQVGENEYTGNIDDNYEFDAVEEKWIKRQNMPFTRGHASSSTTAVPCGYIIAGGSTNEYGKTKDITFYDITSNRWTKIGELPNALNTPVCAIDYAAGMYYCETGWYVYTVWERTYFLNSHITNHLGLTESSLPNEKLSCNIALFILPFENKCAVCRLAALKTNQT